jgi:UDP-N-acetylmuramate--alanine ligase
VELGAPAATALTALSSFSGVDRRSQIKGEARGILVMDDYGHHPTEVQAVLQGIREAYDRRIVVAFQPHRYSRTQDLAERFHTAFYAADVLYVTDIYAAGETPIPGVSAETLVEGIRNHGHRAVHYVADVAQLPAVMQEELREGDLVITLGAGNIWQASEALLARLQGGNDE